MKKIIQKLILICLCLVLSQPIFVYAKHGNPTVTAWVENDSIKFKIDGLNSDGKVTDYKILFFSKWIETSTLTFKDCIEIVKNFSKEIEYCEENLQKLDDVFNNSNDFSINNLIGLF